MRRSEGGHEHTLFAEPLFNVGGFTVTNSLLTSGIALIVILIVALIFRARLTTIPRKLQSAVEMVMEQLMVFLT
jgi:F0F1-type ATP synthase membrane subunit a